MSDIIRDELVRLCTDAIVPHSKWRNRDTASAQIQLGIARALLAAGCEFRILESGSLASDEKTLWVYIEWKGFAHFDWDGGLNDDTFYIPTRARLDKAAGNDWY